MAINTFGFLAFFICVFIAYYFLSKNRATIQNVWLLLASFLFYAIADFKMIIIPIIATILFYFIGIKIYKTKNTPPHSHIEGGRKATAYTVLGIVLGVGALIYFKYFNFFIQSFSELFNRIGLHTNPQTFNIILPVGISFFTFKLMSYVIEIRRGTIEPCKDIVAFSTYVAFFPTLLSGPIDRPKAFISQLKQSRTLDYALAVDGCKQVLWGMIKKMLVADRIAVFIDDVWLDVGSQSGFALLMAAILYSFQIYCDFSGYSDMAIGVSKILGLNIAKNFNYPYFARNISEFWRKWHMSLTSWFTDYIYIPLGGNRKGTFRTIINTLIVFTVCGLWHGASWTFVLWGFVNGLLFIPLLLQKHPKKYKGEALNLNIRTIVRILITFMLATICWVAFRAPDLNTLLEYFSALFSNDLGIDIRMLPNVGVLFLAVVIVMEWLKRNDEYPLQNLRISRYSFVRICFYALLFIITYTYRGNATTFIYAGF